ncbi:4328_t:CDS:10, partial [Acaulospora morrowiae]
GTNNNLVNPNAGSINQPLLRITPANTTNFFDSDQHMLPCPGNYANTTSIKCPPPSNETLPLVRCISDRVDGIQMKSIDRLEINFRENLKSSRNVSHMNTFFGDWLAFDISSPRESLDLYRYAIMIPSDDSTYLSYGTESITVVNKSYLPMNRTWYSNNTSESKTLNEVTSFLDASAIYGFSEQRLNSVLRDPSDRCMMLMNYSSSYAGDLADAKFGYLPLDSNGEYIVGYQPLRGVNAFTNFYQVIFMREHNRRCRDLRSWYGSAWDDDQYFQESRKWVIALLQKVVFLEYLPTILGRPLDTYNNSYDPNLTPGIDTFFSSATFRYGHSEVSDYYTIIDEFGGSGLQLHLYDVLVTGTLEMYGVPRIAASLSLQRQEELDIFYADFMRAHRPDPSSVHDIASIDHFRGRDQGLPSYNQVRQNYGFLKANDWSDITNNTDVQMRLMSTYANVNQLEAFVGGLAEDHVIESSFGPLFLKSMISQWSRIRNSDRFYYQNSDAGFNDSEILEINRTSWRDIIIRNTPANTPFFVPQNPWIVQPRAALDNLTVDGDGYSRYNVFPCSDGMYNIQWKLTMPTITFKLTIQASQAWFGIGFSNGGGMVGADFIIARTTDPTIEVANYRSVGNQIPVKDDAQIVTVLSSTIVNGVSQVEFSYPLNAPNKQPITDTMKILICAWKPGTNVLSPHISNWNRRNVNFFATGFSQVTVNKYRQSLLVHGIAMVVIWSVIFPASIYIVRYMKHSYEYKSQHKNLQMIGGVSVFVFGAVGMSVADPTNPTPHHTYGIVIYSLVFVQLGLGLLTTWCLASVESVNRGLCSFIKKIHLLFGFALMSVSGYNIYLGIELFGEDPNYTWRRIYLGWLGFILIIFLISEIRHNISGYKFIRPSSEAGNSNQCIRSYIHDAVFEKLLILGWDDINKRVAGGASLVVAEGLVFDIRKWIDVHPGGAKTLQRVIGTDITNDFYFKEDKGSSRLAIDDFQQNIILGFDSVNQYEHKDDEVALTQINKKSERIPKQEKEKSLLSNTSISMANVADRLNANTFKEASRLAMHSHSKFATEKLASM